MPAPKVNFKPSLLVKKKKPQEEDTPPGQPLGVGGVNAGSLSGTLGSFPIGQSPRE